MNKKSNNIPPVLKIYNIRLVSLIISFHILMDKVTSETSPHAWSKLKEESDQWGFQRNISTCVEQTSRSEHSRPQSWKHLHMRGANTTKSCLFALNIQYIESPYAIPVKEQNQLLIFPLILSSANSIYMSAKEYINTIPQKFNFLTILYRNHLYTRFYILTSKIGQY